jgi:hypothetical protein
LRGTGEAPLGSGTGVACTVAVPSSLYWAVFVDVSRVGVESCVHATTAAIPPAIRSPCGTRMAPPACEEER